MINKRFLVNNSIINSNPNFNILALKKADSRL